MRIEEIEDEIIQEFSTFDNWIDKYAYLIEIGNNIKNMAEEKKREEILISGCQSRVWLEATYKDNKIIFAADSDAIITKGIIALLIRVFSWQTPQEIINANISFIEKIGLNQHLSPTRSNGLYSMLKQIKYYAVVFDKLNK